MLGQPAIQLLSETGETLILRAKSGDLLRGFDVQVFGARGQKALVEQLQIALMPANGLWDVDQDDSSAVSPARTLVSMARARARQEISRLPQSCGLWPQANTPSSWPAVANSSGRD